MKEEQNAKETSLCSIDTTAEAIRQAEAGSSDAIRHLLNQVANEILATGSITNIRLRLWFSGWLDQQIATLPASRAGAPSKRDQHFDIALRVEIHRLKPENGNSKESTRGLALNQAIEHVASTCDYSIDTVETYHKKYRREAKQWIELYGPRLAYRGGPKH
jgi:hypothetical protein